MSDGTFDPLVFDSGVFDTELGGHVLTVSVSASTAQDVEVSASTYSIEVS